MLCVLIIIRIINWVEKCRMLNVDLFIMVVDDVWFFGVVIGCIFKVVGFKDICIVSSV